MTERHRIALAEAVGTAVLVIGGALGAAIWIGLGDRARPAGVG